MPMKVIGNWSFILAETGSDLTVVFGSLSGSGRSRSAVIPQCDVDTALQMADQCFLGHVADRDVVLVKFHQRMTGKTYAHITRCLDINGPFMISMMAYKGDDDEYPDHCLASMRDTPQWFILAECDFYDDVEIHPIGGNK